MPAKLPKMGDEAFRRTWGNPGDAPRIQNGTPFAKQHFNYKPGGTQFTFEAIPSGPQTHELPAELFNMYGSLALTQKGTK